jgi:hypothetical protein
MSDNKSMILAAKCAPDNDIFCSIRKAGIGALEIYLSKNILKDIDAIIKLCGKFSFRYAIHSPNDSFEPEKLAELSKAINAEVAVFHNIYWDNEWDKLVKIFNNVKTKVCIENIASCNEAAKFERRYGFGRCLDLEHLQMESCGVYEEEFIRVLEQASHIHLTGYEYGSIKWHTHIHNSSKHGRYLLSLLRKADYAGFVVSEANVKLQSYQEFKKLKLFWDTFC